MRWSWIKSVSFVSTRPFDLQFHCFAFVSTNFLVAPFSFSINCFGFMIRTIFGGREGDKGTVFFFSLFLNEKRRIQKILTHHVFNFGQTMEPLSKTHCRT
jgi:hypothetical protein